MVKKTLELYECDKCGENGKRYSILFEDGTLLLDRCARHATKIEALRNEQGEWAPITHSGLGGFRKSNLAELRLAVENGKRGRQDGTP